jgi:hypothetical protein
MKQWFEDAWWSWECCIYSRFVDYNDNIDVAAFWEELNYGSTQMRYEYLMSQTNFDPYNMGGRDSYYTYVMSKK